MEIIHLLSAVAAFGLAIRLAAEVLATGQSSAWSGYLFADHLSALVLLLTAFVYLVCAPYSIGYLRAEERGDWREPGETAPVLYADSAPDLLHVSGYGGQQPGGDVGGAGGHHAGIHSAGDVLWPPHLAGSGLEIRHDRRRGAFHGAVRHHPHLLRGAPGAGHGEPARAELAGAGSQRGEVRSHRDAAGVHSGSARLWDQGGPGAHAYLETRRVQRSAHAGGGPAGYYGSQLRPVCTWRGFTW